LGIEPGLGAAAGGGVIKPGLFAVLACADGGTTAGPLALTLGAPAAPPAFGNMLGCEVIAPLAPLALGRWTVVSAPQALTHSARIKALVLKRVMFPPRLLTAADGCTTFSAAASNIARCVQTTNTEHH
jgi:hypothetical protein